LLTRTSSEGPKHRGLTMFLVPMDTPGISIEPMPTLGAPGRTNRTVYRDVVVPDSARVGEVNGGWDVMTVALTFERGGMFAALRALNAAADWARTARRPDSTRVIDDPLVRRRLAWVAIENEVATLLSHRTTWLAATGRLPGVEGSMAKLFTSESTQRSCASLMDVLGPAGLLDETAGDAPAGGTVEYAFRKAAVGRIYGGTSEIMRSIIAERGLGLPKTRASR
jgi:alkylation response protein AidB-like acyl-CoA dehydrogenase